MPDFSEVPPQRTSWHLKKAPTTKPLPQLDNDAVSREPRNGVGPVTASVLDSEVQVRSSRIAPVSHRANYVAGLYTLPFLDKVLIVVAVFE